MRRLVFILFIVVVSTPLLHAQQHKVDSILALINSKKIKDSVRVNDFIRLCDLYRYMGDMARSKDYGDSALSLAQKLSYKSGTYNAYQSLGNIYLETGQPLQALQYQLKAQKLAEASGDKDALASITGNIGNIYELQGDFLKAMDCFTKALKLEEALGEKGSMAINTNNIGIVYAEQGNLPKSLEYFFKALNLYREAGNKNGVAQVTGNIGIIYNDEGDRQKALDFYSQALQLDKDIGDKNGIATNTGNIGSVYNVLGDYNKAKDYLTEALKLSVDIDNKQLELNNLTNLGNTYRNMGNKGYMDYYVRALKIAEALGSKTSIEKILGCIGEGYTAEKNYPEAEKYLIQGLNVAEQIGDLSTIKELSGDLSGTYEGAKDWAKAYTYYKEFSLYKDSVVNGEKSKEIGRLEAQSEYDKQLALQKADEDKKAALSDAERRRQRFIILFITAIALAVVIITITVFRALKTTRTQKQVIEFQKIAVEQQKKLFEEKNKEVLDSITYAKRLQDAMLPPLSEVRRALPGSFVLYKPKAIVAGDFYWMELIPTLSLPASEEGKSQRSTFSPPVGRIQEGMVFLAAADCTGHGVPGAMVSVVCSNALDRAVKEFGITDTARILDQVRDLVLETFSHKNNDRSAGDVRDGMDISLVSIAASPPSKVGSSNDANESQTGGPITLQWAGANIPLILIKGDSVLEIAPDRQPIGKHESHKAFTAHTIPIQNGDMLYLCTDGFADQFGGPQGKKFMHKNLLELLLGISKLPVDQQKTKLDDTFENWKGQLEQVDDVLIIGVRI